MNPDEEHLLIALIKDLKHKESVGHDISRDLIILRSILRDEFNYYWEEEAALHRQENSMDEQQIQVEIDQLNNSLQIARSKLVEQQEVLMQLCSPPLAHATIVAINRISTPAATPSPKDFKKGVKVRLRADSQYAQQNSNSGIIIGNGMNGWINVRFNDGDKNQYRTGLKVRGDSRCDGSCDLEIVSSKVNLDTVTIINDNSFYEVRAPVDVAVEPGDSALISTETMQIVETMKNRGNGELAPVRQVIDDRFIEVESQGGSRVIFSGKFSGKVEKGDRIVLDNTSTVAVNNLGKEDTRFRFTANTQICWDDIGGLEAAKLEMVEAVELPYNNPEIYARYKKKMIKGVLLYGPPGCGKTMLGKATATALTGMYEHADSGFMYIKGPEILNRFVGTSEETIRQIFQQARNHKEEHGYPAVIFIDEADAILSKRGSGVSSDVEKTIVPMFLTEMDGLDDSGALVILATNRSDILDPAVIRDGRVDRKIKITRPTPESTATIFELNLRDKPFSNGDSVEDMALLGSNELFKPERVLYTIETKQGTQDFNLGHIVNGGMIVSIVDQATSFAMRRDLASKSEHFGMTSKDLISAIDGVEQQNRDLNHSDDLADYVEDFRDDVINIRRPRQST
jgi:proteasome ATPase